MFGKLDTEETERLIETQLIGRIGCHANDQTYIVPVSYAYDGNYIYGYTHEGKKIDMMRKNPNVCFEVDDTRNLANWQSVIAWGVFEELTDKKERKETLKKLHERVLPVVNSETMRISPMWPFSTDDLDELKGIVYRILLTEKTGRFEKSSDHFFYAT